jgi:adenine/guanine/hypoxanthine permease
MKIKKILPQYNIKIEIFAGLTTYLTMAYIIFVNPTILSVTGMEMDSLIAVTCIVSGITSILTGLLTNLPIAMAPGMGLNAFFAYSLVLTDNINWQTALGIVFLSGLFFLILTIVGFRQKLVEAIPRELLASIAVGIGLFISLIGLQNLGIVVKNEATMISSGPITPEVLVGLGGLLIMVFLELKKIKGSLLIGIAASTLMAIIFGQAPIPETYLSYNIDISPIFFQLDIFSALKFSFIIPIFTLMFMDLFDSLGTLIGCAQEADLIDEKGNIEKLDRLLGLDAISTMFGALLGTSTTTTYVESAAGIADGGKTGLTAISTGIFFLLSVFFIPIIAIVPSHATAPALLMVGFFMLKNVANIDFNKFENSFSSFIILIMIALSYSISAGLAFGFISFVIIKIFKGEIKSIKPALWLIFILSIIHFMV